MKEAIRKIHWFLSSQVGINAISLYKSIPGMYKFMKDFIHYRRVYTGEMTLKPCVHDWNQEGELKERHNPETHLLPIIMQAVNKQRDSVSIFGTNYDTDDGTCIRDYIHVNDLTRAHLKGLDYLNNINSPSLELNLGSETGYSVKEVINEAKRITGKDFTTYSKVKRSGDPSVLVASKRKASSKLNFELTYDSLEKIIKTLI